MCVVPDAQITDRAALLATCTSVEEEYWMHVSSQEELPIAVGVERSPVTAELDKILEELPDGSDTDALAAYFRERLLVAPTLLNELRLLISLSDKRLYLDLSYRLSREIDPGDPERTLCGCEPQELTKHSTSFFVRLLKSKRSDGAVAAAVADVVARYFIEKGLAEVCRLYRGLDAAEREVLMRTLVLPSEFRQNEAKRRGHGAEVELARLISALGCSILPADKVDNPMGHDPNVDKTTFELAEREAGLTFSFDLIVTSPAGKVRVCIQSLIHSSDPGQFGVDKSNETVSIRDQLDVVNATLDESDHVEVWCLLDGVGYCENKNGTLNKMLPKAHTFIQLKSLYKAALRLHEIGLCSIKGIHFDPTFYSVEARESMSRYVPDDVEVVIDPAAVPEDWKVIPPGHAKATIYV
jgi:hypothetical protein